MSEPQTGSDPGSPGSGPDQEAPAVAGEAAPDYEAAVDRLDEIIARLDSGDARLRETLALCEEAKGLIEYCAGELAAVDQGLKELRLDELAATLSASPGGGSTAAPGDGESPAGTPPPEDGPPPGDDSVPF